MNQTLSLVFVLMVPIFLMGQSNSIYFPQEQIVINGCEKDADTPGCFYNSLERKVSQFLQVNQKGFKKMVNDTLEMQGFLVVDKDGTINKAKSGFTIKSKKIGKSIKQDFTILIEDIPIIEVVNQKPSSYTSRHFLGFKYLVSKSNQGITFNKLPLTKKYSGGVIEEVPRFPGCETLNEEEAQICFQKRMQEHIAYHFRYPEEAKQLNITGRVTIIFVISKEGKIENIRTKGPHKLLEEEAVRIIKYLPNMIPAKQNGIPVKIPFSIPITFKL